MFRKLLMSVALLVGACTGASADVFDIVFTSGTQTIDGTKTFLEPLIAPSIFADASHLTGIHQESNVALSSSTLGDQIFSSAIYVGIHNSTVPLHISIQDQKVAYRCQFSVLEAGGAEPIYFQALIDGAPLTAGEDTYTGVIERFNLPYPISVQIESGALSVGDHVFSLMGKSGTIGGAQQVTIKQSALNVFRCWAWEL